MYEYQDDIIAQSRNIQTRGLNCTAEIRGGIIAAEAEQVAMIYPPPSSSILLLLEA